MENIKEQLENKHPSFSEKLSCYKFLSEEQQLKYAEILLKTDDPLLARAMREVMCSSSANQAGVVVDGLEILKQLKNEKQYIASIILANRDTNHLGIALAMVAEISLCQREYNAKKIMDLVYIMNDFEEMLRNMPETRNFGQHGFPQLFLKCSTCLREASFEEQADCMIHLMTNITKSELTARNFLQNNLIYSVLDGISQAKEPFQVQNMEQLFRQKIEDPYLLLGSIAVINQTSTVEECEKKTEQLRILRTDDILPYLGHDLNIVSTVLAAIDRKTITTSSSIVKRKTI